MSVVWHFRFGYLAQVSSFLSLGLANIVLPNQLGVIPFATLNEAMAFVAISCIVFNEGVAYLVIRRIRDLRINFKEAAGSLLSQSTFEHFILAVCAVLCLFGVISVINPQHGYGLFDWILIVVTALIVAAYIPCIAIFTATLHNRVVFILAFLNGIFSFVFPIGLNYLGWDIRFSIGLTYGFCYLICVIYFRLNGVYAWFSTFDPRRTIIISRALFPLIAPTALRLSIFWVPVILFVDSGQVGEAAAYKIAISIAFGVLTLVPFHKQTMLSVDGAAPAAYVKAIAPVAILLASVGSLFLIGLAKPITSLLFSSDFHRLADFIPLLAPFLVLHVIVDVLLVALISRHFDKFVLLICLSSMLLSLMALLMVQPYWYPTLSLVFFCAFVAVVKPALFSGNLLLRAVMVSLAASVSALVFDGRGGLIAGAFILILILLLDNRLRTVFVETIMNLLSIRKPH